MQDEEARLKREIAGLLKQAEAQDQADEDRYGPDDRNRELPAELKRREDPLKVIEAAKARLEERQPQADKAEARCVDEARVTRRMTSPRCTHACELPRSNAQYNFTDPESLIISTSAASLSNATTLRLRG